MRSMIDDISTMMIDWMIPASPLKPKRRCLKDHAMSGAPELAVAFSQVSQVKSIQ